MVKSEEGGWGTKRAFEFGFSARRHERLFSAELFTSNYESKLLPQISTALITRRISQTLSIQ